MERCRDGNGEGLRVSAWVGVVTILGKEAIDGDSEMCHGKAVFGTDFLPTILGEARPSHH